MNITFPNATLYFCLLGCGIAGVRHLVAPYGVFEDLTPVALMDSPSVHDEKPSVNASAKAKTIHPAARWWGGYAFSAMNVGFLSVGLYGVATDSTAVKDAYLLSTGIMFCTFSAMWLNFGKITGKVDYLTQSAKILGFGSLFLAAFVYSVQNPRLVY